MVKCPKCKGRGMIGKIVPNILTGKGAIFADYECDCCKGKGEVTEKKAENWIRRNTNDTLLSKTYTNNGRARKIIKKYCDTQRK